MRLPKINLLLIFQRIITFPFIFGIALIGSVVYCIKLLVNYTIYGAELNIYSKQIHRKTIQDVFTKLSEMQECEQSKMHTKNQPPKNNQT